MHDRAEPRLPEGGAIHLIGAGGAGMSALAKILVGKGHRVTGADLKPSRQLDALRDAGVETWVGHHPERMRAMDLVVASSAVPLHDPELTAARTAGVPTWMRPRLLEALTALHPAIGLAGTHGKTTSTALAVTALRSSGVDPTFIVGGEMAAFNTGAHLGDPDVFVLEADEAFGTFRHLHLAGMLVTNIEPDHLDYYETVAALEEAFALVANRVDGPVLGCWDDPGVRRLAERAPVIGYGTSEGAAWRIDALTHGPGEIRFELAGPDRVPVAVMVPKPGAHIARNAAGVVALLAELGHDAAAMAAGLASYQGVRRRFEVRGTVGGVTLVDDYAHHPTEIAATIAAGRHGGWDRVWAVFQPHRYTRTADLAGEFGAPLAAADGVVVTDVYSAGEAPIPGVTGRLVDQAVRAAGGVVDYVPGLMDTMPWVLERAGEGDLVLLLGAGDITSLAEPLLLALDRRAAG